MNNFALVVEKRGDALRAAEILEEVLDGFRHFKERKWEVIQTKKNLASVLKTSNLERACTLLQEALTDSDGFQLPDTHPLKLNLLKEIGGIAHNRGDYVQAKAPLRRTVEALAAVGGDSDSPTTIYAWAIFNAELRTEDPAADETRERYLGWLLRVDVEQLSPEQQHIRADVLRRAQGQEL